MLSVILLSMLMILHSKVISGKWSVATTRVGCWTWIWWTRHRTRARSGLFQYWKKSTCFVRSCNTDAIDVKMEGSAVEEKPSLKIPGFSFFSKLDWGSYIISIAKTASKKIGALVHSMKFLFPEVAPYLYQSTIRPCMEHCCHVGAGAPSCYLEMLNVK